MTKKNAVFKCSLCGFTYALTRSQLRVKKTPLCHTCRMATEPPTRLKLVEGLPTLKHPQYARWKGLINRCENAKQSNYHLYGGRGITVCPEWHDFATFAAWCSASGYQPGLSIDRRDNDGPYAPWNCKWSTRSEQNLNRRPFKIAQKSVA